MSNKDNDEVEDLLGDIEDNINKNLIPNTEDKTPNSLKNNNNNTPENNGNNDNELVEVEDIGVNTDELPPEELQKLIENNEDLMEANEEDYTKEVQEEKIRLQKE